MSIKFNAVVFSKIRPEKRVSKRVFLTLLDVDRYWIKRQYRRDPDKFYQYLSPIANPVIPKLRKKLKKHPYTEVVNGDTTIFSTWSWHTTLAQVSLTQEDKRMKLLVSDLVDYARQQGKPSLPAQVVQDLLLSHNITTRQQFETYYAPYNMFLEEFYRVREQKRRDYLQGLGTPIQTGIQTEHDSLDTNADIYGFARRQETAQSETEETY